MEELFSGSEDAIGKTNTYVKENWNIKKNLDRKYPGNLGDYERLNQRIIVIEKWRKKTSQRNIISKKS